MRTAWRAAQRLSFDELSALGHTLDRVAGNSGLRQYGNLDLRADGRDWGRETAEELADAVFYTSVLVERVRRGIAR